MKTLASVAFGVAALAAASMGFAQPAAARSNVGIYVSPYGITIGVDGQRNNCRDDWYRRTHWNYCRQFYDGYYGSGYYNNDYGGYYRNTYRPHRSVRHDRYDQRRHDWGNRGDRRRDHRRDR